MDITCQKPVLLSEKINLGIAITCDFEDTICVSDINRVPNLCNVVQINVKWMQSSPTVHHFLKIIQNSLTDFKKKVLSV